MITPKTRPRLSEAELMAMIHSRFQHSGVIPDLGPLFVVGIRGYYRKTMGDPSKNDFGIYDDALFVVGPNAYATFNGNTDPSRMLPGVAVLNAGIWPAYRLEKHKGKYLALCQRAGSVTVARTDDKGRTFDDNGFFGINIHKGSASSTSSEGCQTVYPSQWTAFIELVTDQAKRLWGNAWNKKTITYVLLDN